MRGMRCAIAAMAAEGDNLIVDDVLLGGGDAEYAALLEARERRRGDRLIGLARWQYDRLHTGMRDADGLRRTDQAEVRPVAQKRLCCLSSVVSPFDDPTWTAAPQGWRDAPPPSAASALTRRGPCQSGF
jgi:hypothetical protein